MKRMRSLLALVSLVLLSSFSAALAAPTPTTAMIVLVKAGGNPSAGTVACWGVTIPSLVTP